MDYLYLKESMNHLYKFLTFSFLRMLRILLEQVIIQSFYILIRLVQNILC